LEKTEDNGRADEEMDEEGELKSTSPRSDKKQGSKRASRREAVKIEDDEIPF
jgi:hypothetical protein